MTPADSSTSRDGAPEASASPETPAVDAQDAKKLRNTVNGFIAIGDRCRDARNWEGARSNYEQALSLNPSMQAIWIQLGHSRKESGDHAAAEEAYREATRLDPADPEAQLQLGHLFKIRNMIAPALEAFGRALELDPSLGDARVEIARLQEKIGAQKPAASRSVTPMASRY